ncbi:predicted protein [Nematostella vectensis]|uniref:Helitron helicase-like domain-containing protein n=1 Tax=Nematostella vectensis TaxID=45351 RepID=A7S9C4_NEMVE|nr:predicted protein [Nematostella vectensis]|eukprot:XP_001631710.1 predicted protein [Nematostella vectensis]
MPTPFVPVCSGDNAAPGLLPAEPSQENVVGPEKGATVENALLQAVETTPESAAVQSDFESATELVVEFVPEQAVDPTQAPANEPELGFEQVKEPLDLINRARAVGVEHVTQGFMRLQMNVKTDIDVLHGRCQGKNTGSERSLETHPLDRLQVPQSKKREQTVLFKNLSSNSYHTPLVTARQTITVEVTRRFNKKLNAIQTSFKIRPGFLTRKSRVAEFKFDHARTTLQQLYSDLLSRVLNLKLKELLKDITKYYVLGVVVAHLYVIEFQKRRLRHAHLLVFLDREVIDEVVSAEFQIEGYNQSFMAIVSLHESPIRPRYNSLPRVDKIADLQNSIQQMELTLFRHGQQATVVAVYSPTSTAPSSPNTPRHQTDSRLPITKTSIEASPQPISYSSPFARQSLYSPIRPRYSSSLRVDKIADLQNSIQQMEVTLFRHGQQTPRRTTHPHPHPTISNIHSSGVQRSELRCAASEERCSKEELVGRNLAGARGKPIVIDDKIAEIKEIVFVHFPTASSARAAVLRQCHKTIDTYLRRLNSCEK